MAAVDGLVTLDARWQLWETFMLRSAGFPIAGVLDLASPEAAAAADAVLERKASEAEARARAIEAHLERRGERKVLKRLRSGGPPEGADASLEAAYGALVEAQHELARAFEEAARRTTDALRAIVERPRFREAVLWQNSQAYRRAVTTVGGDTLNTRERQRQQLVASYWQRYCTKNETIGYFGPVGWARCGGDTPIEVVPGPALVGWRAVYFEHWGIDALASALAGDQELLCDLAPRALPTVRVSGTHLFVGAGPSIELSPLIARLLVACDGQRSARQIASTFVGGELDSEEDVYDLLQQLVEQRLVAWTIELPSAVLEPERRLRELLQGLPPSEARLRALAALERLAAARERVAAAGEPEALEHALEHLDGVFTELTHAAPTRRPGEAYAGRTLVYPECRRDLALRIGRPVLDRLAPALTLFLSSGRWYTHEVALRYRSVLESAYGELAAHGPVRYQAWWELVAPHFEVSQRRPSPMVDAVLAELRRRWRELLSISPDRRRVELRASDLAPHVAHAFAAPSPGWPSARHLSPDVMIAARDAAAIGRGEALFVLGEIHIGNTMMSSAHLHPDRGVLFAAVERDIPGAQVSPVERRDVVTRVDRVSRVDRDYHLELGASRSWRPRERVLRIADLVVERTERRLEVVDSVRGLRFDAIAFLDQYLSFAASSHFRWAAHEPHTPRVTIDNVVVIREQWCCEPAELDFAHAKEPADRYLGARAWARRHGFPRWVFVKTPEEIKPIFIDFASPLLVELLAKLLRQAAAVTVSEMLPDPEHVWLPDGAGHTYTSELRLTAVDDVPWRAAAERHGR